MDKITVGKNGVRGSKSLDPLPRRLVDILALELKVWPEGTVEFVAQQSDGSLCLFKGPYFEKSCLGFTVEKFTKASDLAVALVYRGMWQAARDALIAHNPSLHLQEFGRIARVASEWNGEGLPPVGVRIEIAHKDAQPDWARPGFYETKIIAMGEQLMILEADGSGHEKVAKISAYHFRPIRTAEQIAADERLREIEEIRKILSDAHGDHNSAIALHKAGYRKQEQSK